MSKRLLLNKLININDIDEELIAIPNSNTDFIIKKGNVYSDYGNNNYLLRAKTINSHNQYVYTRVKFINGYKQVRLHRLLATIFIPNSDPNKNTIVMHLDNNKQNNALENLKWGSIQENTQQAFDDALIVNKKGFEDSQSIPVVVFNLNKEIIDTCGSVSIASKKYNVTKGGILYQCNHKVKTKTRKPKCNHYFRFLQEFQNLGFVL